MSHRLCADVGTHPPGALARRLLASLDASMMLLADRNFAGYELWAATRATGAHMVWRIKQNAVFDPLEVPPDGSFLANMRTPADNVRYGQARAAGSTLKATPHGHLVRIINDTVTVHPIGGPPQKEVFRLVTSLLNHKHAPARQLAMTHHRRWEIENCYAEIKNRLRGAGFVLRAKLPELVSQEVYALLAVYQALCIVEVQSAERAGIDPERVSFTVTVQLVRLSATDQAAADTATLGTARRQITEDLLDALLPPRRDRRCAAANHVHLRGACLCPWGHRRCARAGRPATASESYLTGQGYASSSLRRPCGRRGILLTPLHK